jgi:diaminohydroxyphosphoribosylaminopyrimidine deaminase / 5-amino-6-(5-phosphoribosylamino)uracil reductase
MTPETAMALALDAAWEYQGLTYPNPAVGCAVLGPRGELLAVDAHRRAGGPHAEVLALKAAYRLLSGDQGIDPLESSDAIHDYLQTHHDGCFAQTTLCVTLEPCAHRGKTPACAALIAALKPAEVIIAHEDPNPEAAGGAALLEAAGIAVRHGVLRERGADLLLPFQRWQAGRFLFFKWAQRLDGTVDGGVISGKASRTAVHAMRDVCDLLVIGGNTVRHDRPTLDARLVGGKAPDVLILSRGEEFDRSIPLFGVTDRKVVVSESPDTMEGYRNVMVEGGPGMFEAFYERADCFVCFVAPTTGGTISFTNLPAAFRILHRRQSGDDVMLWMIRGETALQPAARQ